MTTNPFSVEGIDRNDPRAAVALVKRWLAQGLANSPQFNESITTLYRLQDNPAELGRMLDAVIPELGAFRLGAWQSLAMQDRTHLLTSLFEPQNIFQIVGKIATVVEDSYRSHPCERTAYEDKRRASICVDAVVLMRGDMKWSTMRILDHIKQALIEKLNGGTFTPSNRNLWLPGDA